MNKYTFNEIEYYNADDVYNFEPESFVGCSKTSRLIVKNKKLKDNEFIYMKYIKSRNEWIPSEETYKTAKVFITCEWIHKNLIKFKKQEEKTEEDINIEASKAPPLLELNDEEKFVDIDGNILDIEIRGTKNINDIYFKVKDVSEKFKLGDINKILLNKDSSFNIDLHYKLFKVLKVVDPETKSIKKGQKLLFLTFKGLTKLLYVSHSKNAEHFQDWVNNIIYTYQFGSREDKIELFSPSLGINSKVVKEFFNTEANTMPCIYLFTLGTVKDLRDSMNINEKYNDNDIICKYGLTKDLKRRTTEHEKKFSSIKGIKLNLKFYSYIDPFYVYNAENDIKLFTNSLKLNFQYENNEELIIVSKDLFKIIEQQYLHISKKYMGHITELNQRIKDLEHQLELISVKYEKEISQKDKELLQKDIENLKTNHELLLVKKELELIKK